MSVLLYKHHKLLNSVAGYSIITLAGFISTNILFWHIMPFIISFSLVFASLILTITALIFIFTLYGLLVFINKICSLISVSFEILLRRNKMNFSRNI